MRLSALGQAILFLTVAATTATAAEDSKGEAAPSLPLSKVVLYSSGVGYFQHDGTVQGNTRLDLRFKADRVNDLLKSLVVQDFGGGRIPPVTFESRDPITKTLQGFGINLTDNPSLGQLLNQVRGERIEVAAPTIVTGTILGIERKEQPVGTGNQQAVVQVESVNLVTDEGLRSIALGQIQRIRLLNDRLNDELQQALAVLATGHDTERKTVGLTFEGRGARQVRVAYLIETPIWKTTYRLVLEEEGPPLLQGWAIVENTTDQDWNAVRLSLVSGRPISFTMNLYQPLYATRPVVEPESYASLRPPVYDEAMESKSMAAGGGEAPRPVAPPHRAMARATTRPEPSGAAEEPAMLTPPPGFDLTQGVSVGAKGLETGALFQYAMEASVSLPRQTSAMLPVLSRKIDGDRLSIYNPSVHARYPLNGYRLKNTSALYLMQGPITVFDGGAYAGDARIEDLAPGQERLIGYAVDLKSEVEALGDPSRQELVGVSIRKGTLLATRKLIEAKAYHVRNRDQKQKTVLIEHPFRPDWTLKEPAEAPERTRDLYRFPVTVEAGRSAVLRVREERHTQHVVRLAVSGSDLLLYYLQGTQVIGSVRDALQKVVALRDRLSESGIQRTRLEQQVKDIAQEQARIREKMAKLPQNSELYGRYVKKLDRQETETETLHKGIEALKGTEAAQRKELNDYVLGLDLEG
jgi:hypothetical protein